MPGRSYTSARTPHSCAARPCTPTVTPCQLPVFACPPVRALNSVDLPQLGLPTSSSRGAPCCAPLRFSAPRRPEPPAFFFPRRGRRPRRLPYSAPVSARMPCSAYASACRRGVFAPDACTEAATCACAHMREEADGAVLPATRTVCTPCGAPYPAAVSAQGHSAASIVCASVGRTARRTPSASSISPPPKGARRKRRTRRPAAMLSMRSRSARAGGAFTDKMRYVFPHSALSSFIPLSYARMRRRYAPAALPRTAPAPQKSAPAAVRGALRGTKKARRPYFTQKRTRPHKRTARPPATQRRKTRPCGHARAPYAT